jgi:hypothetical protein
MYKMRRHFILSSLLSECRFCLLVGRCSRQRSAFPSPGGTKERGRGRGVVEAAPYCSPVPVSGGGGEGGGFQLVMSKHSGRNSVELSVSKIVTSFLAKGDGDNRGVTTVYNTLKQRERSPSCVF